MTTEQTRKRHRSNRDVTGDGSRYISTEVINQNVLFGMRWRYIQTSIQYYSKWLEKHNYNKDIEYLCENRSKELSDFGFLVLLPWVECWRMCESLSNNDSGDAEDIIIEQDCFLANCLIDKLIYTSRSGTKENMPICITPISESLEVGWSTEGTMYVTNPVSFIFPQHLFPVELHNIRFRMYSPPRDIFP